MAEGGALGQLAGRAGPPPPVELPVRWQFRFFFADEAAKFGAKHRILRKVAAEICTRCISFRAVELPLASVHCSALEEIEFRGWISS